MHVDRFLPARARTRQTPRKMRQDLCVPQAGHSACIRRLKVLALAVRTCKNELIICPSAYLPGRFPVRAAVSSAGQRTKFHDPTCAVVQRLSDSEDCGIGRGSFCISPTDILPDDLATMLLVLYMFLPPTRDCHDLQQTRIGSTKPANALKCQRRLGMQEISV